MEAKFSKCPFQCVEGGLIGEYVYPECMGNECAAYIEFSHTCFKTGQKVVVRPKP